MKGISTILATILIVIIVVAIIGLTYTFSVTLFQQAAGGATNATVTTVGNIQKSVAIVSATCVPALGGQNATLFTIRHLGSIAITYNNTASELTTLLDGNDISTTACVTGSVPLRCIRGVIGSTAQTFNAGTLSDQFNHTATGLSGTAHTLVVSSPAGSDSIRINC